MKLRSLNIKGFKSFANDTTIHFNDEIIGIVGPNGSGKSNIVDAIRWVLGEQKSKELRLEKMVDVIFNGTKSKKKAAMAQVSMTFENSKKLIPLEYDNVKVTRVLFANNDSEYRINDVPCRLKDIRNLFMDTGIGSNSYSIIELGMVDDILTDKDQARRKMFEQAAGISKYKSRKHQTLLKLKSTQVDLDRIEDILFELDVNLKKFEKQAKRTKRYYELKEEYKDLSIKQAVLSQKEGIEQETNLKAELVAFQEKFSILSNGVHSLEAEIEQTKKANLDNEVLLTQKQREFSELIDTIRKSESQQGTTKQNLSFVEQNLARVAKNKSEFSTTQEDIKKQLDEKSAALDVLKQKSSELEENYNVWKEKYEDIENRRKDIQGENNSDLNDLKVLEDERFVVQKSIIELNSQSANYEQNKQNILNEQLDLNRDVAIYQGELKTTATQLNNLVNDIAMLTQNKTNLNEQKNQLEGKITNYKDELVTLNRKKDAQGNEVKLLTDMINNLEGFPESSKFLVKEWGQAKPTLSDIIDCEDDYRSTLEAYLDTYLNYFILKDVAEARASIDILRRAQKGKSKFFILSSFLGLPNTQILFDHLGTPALSVVKSDPKYAPLINHLLSKVVIVEDQKILSDEFPDEDVIYLSKNGESNRTKHIIAGGSLGLFDGKRIGRKQEIIKLKNSLKNIEENILNLEKRLVEAQSELEGLNTEDIEKEIENKVVEKNKVDIVNAQLATKNNSANEKLTELNNKIEEYNNSAQLNTTEINKLKSGLDLIIGNINIKQELISSQSGQIEEIAKNFGETSSHFNKAQLNWVQHQNLLKTLENEVDYRKQQSQELLDKAMNAEQEINTLQAQNQNHNQTLEKLREELISQYEVRDNKKEELNSTEQAFFSKRSTVNEKELKLKKLNKDIQEHQFSINNLKDKLTGIGFELRSAMERLKIEFNVDIKTLSKEEILSGIENTDELQLKYQKLRKRIDNYGEINPMAVEAYDEIQSRYESMATQRDDILNAKSSLLETISEIDNDAKDKFLEAFYKAKDNFKEVFRSLFSDEDDCDLVLFDPEDPLNSDIEIIAKPKGKRPKVLNQLSGGEKTLTATALLFSLYLLKPAPFCIFDEVDAPLDDINIQKFSRLIRRFADESQFIIITHNKSTMANLDLLYGVYMQEQGVSGITQVDFKEYEHSEVFRTVNLN